MSYTLLDYIFSGKYESQNITDSPIEHVYTNLLQPTSLYCGGSEENLDISESLSQNLRDDNKNESATHTYTQECVSKTINTSQERLNDIASECSCKAVGTIVNKDKSNVNISCPRDKDNNGVAVRENVESTCLYKTGDNT